MIRLVPVRNIELLTGHAIIWPIQPGEWLPSHKDDSRMMMGLWSPMKMVIILPKYNVI